MFDSISDALALSGVFVEANQKIEQRKLCWIIQKELSQVKCMQKQAPRALLIVMKATTSIDEAFDPWPRFSLFFFLKWILNESNETNAI